MMQSYETNGGFDYINYIDLTMSFGYLLAEYNIVKALLNKLWFVIDDKSIETLASRGYKVDTTKGAKAYKESIEAALKKSENIVTKLHSRANEIANLMKGDGSQRKIITFDEIMASLIVRGIRVDDNITLARYLEVMKVLNRKQEESWQL